MSEQQTPDGSVYQPPDHKPSRWPWLLALLLIIGLGVVIWLWWGNGTPSPKTTARQEGKASPAAQAKAQNGETTTGAPPPPPPSAQGKVIPVPEPGAKPATGGSGAASASGGQAGQKALSREQAARKKPYGIQKSLDVVVRSDEAIKVGDKTVPVSELQRKLVVEQRGKVLEQPLGKPVRISVWGVHVVRPGENLWDIHFRLLREYMKSRGVELPPHADRPTPQGYSSGVGKILKFAEHMVGVYNVQTHRMTSNLNLLEPGRKVVVYNLTEIFEQLAKIDPKDLSGVMYDGRVLFFPEKKLTPNPPPKKNS